MDSYTLVTFSPVQSFIQNSRKLRDLYGSSYLLSYLAWSICHQAGSDQVISPASPNIVQGLPNQIILRGSQDPNQLQKAFDTAWNCILRTCRSWIETHLRTDLQGNPWHYHWKRQWNSWANHSWEFFCVTGQPGQSISEVRQLLNERKRERQWTGVNWMGESSTLSGTDAIAWPELGRRFDPHQQDRRPGALNRGDAEKIKQFYEQLSQTLGRQFIKTVLNPKDWSESQIETKSLEYGEAFITPREQLSIPELTKRLITHSAIIKGSREDSKKEPPTDLISNLKHDFEKRLLRPLVDGDQLNQLLDRIVEDLNPDTFRDLNRLSHKTARQMGQPASSKQTQEHWTGWFQGDGDRASDYLRSQAQTGNAKQEATAIHTFSQTMRDWGRDFKAKFDLPAGTARPCGNGSRVIYAGGDDFLGVLYNHDSQLAATNCLQFWTNFKTQQWKTPTISPSVGFVWAGPKLPQREVLMQCRQAEQAAKAAGRDRIAFRILFNSGNYLQWICPWWVLERGLFEQYCDRDPDPRKGNPWVHLFQDVAVLEARHAFGTTSPNLEVTKALFQAYFGEDNNLLAPENWWNQPQPPPKGNWPPPDPVGILGDPKRFEPAFDGSAVALDRLNRSEDVIREVNDWVINLAKIGFYLHKDWGAHHD